MRFWVIKIHARNSFRTCFIIPVLHLHCSTAAYLGERVHIEMNDIRFNRRKFKHARSNAFGHHYTFSK
jgi:hypothetical protein